MTHGKVKRNQTDETTGPFTPSEAEALVTIPAKNRARAAQKQRRIAQGSLRVFLRKGFHRTTIREIAVACGMSMGQLYHYISCKDDVLFLVYRYMQEVWLEHLKEVRLDDIADPGQRLVRALTHTLEFMARNKDLFLFVYTETKYLERKHLRVVLSMEDHGVVGFWRRLLDEAGVGRAEEHALDLAANLVSFLMVFPVLRGWNLPGSDPAACIPQLVDFILRGLGLEHLALNSREEVRGNGPKP